MQRVIELGPLTHRAALKRLRVFPGFDYRCPVRNRMMAKMRQYHPGAFPPRFFMGLGADADTRYIPTPDQILDVPTPGAWYRIKKGETWWGVSKKAYGQDNVKKGLLTMNKSTWNDHIDRKKKGWEAYKVAGLQATPDYDATNPRAPVMSGTAYPVAWIPPLTGEEPEEVGFVPEVVTTPTPVTTTPPPSSTTTYIKGQKGDKGDKGDPGPPPSSSAIQSAINQYFQTNPPPGGVPGPPGDPGPPPSSSAIQSAVNQYFQTNPPPGGVPGPPGDPGPPPSSSAIQSAVDQWMSSNPPKVVGGGGGDDKQLWTIPLAAMLAWIP